ncbi:hypothetical protein PO124_19805 [Bacillus licheniformis]|nr:hypothetical protein [Bacillus licheniformis]
MNHFLQTKRIGFSLWKKENLNLAKTLWGNRDVTNYLTADGIMTEGEIRNRLLLESNNIKHTGFLKQATMNSSDAAAFAPMTRK